MSKWYYEEGWKNWFVAHEDNDEYDENGELDGSVTSFELLNEDEARELVDILNKYKVPNNVT